MNRREFMTLIGGTAVAWPLAARAQQGERMRRIGVLFGRQRERSGSTAPHRGVRSRAAQLGWTDGRNVRIDYRWGEGNTDTIRKATQWNWSRSRRMSSWPLAAPALAWLLQATGTVPIVFVIVPDPVGSGFVESLARPGGNATGFMQFEYNLCAKWLDLLKEIAPGVTRAAVLRDPTISDGIGQFAVIQAVAPSLGLEVVPIDVRTRTELERAVSAFARFGNSGLIVTASPLTQINRGVIIGLAARHKLPAIYANRTHVDRRRPDLLWARSGRPVPPRGGLCRSHPQGREARRPAGAGADQVRTGDQPQDREGARPDVPPTLLARADEVIE